MRDFSPYPTDLELALACSRGNPGAQRSLFERMKNPMFGVCMRFSANRADAEDLLQEGFIRVFRDIGRYRGEGSLEGWVRRIFVRTAIEDFQRRRKLPEIVNLETLEQALPIDMPFDPENPESVVALLQQLPPGFRAVLNLAVLEDKSHEEIARELGISASTSSSNMERAIAFIKKITLITLLFV